MRMHLATLLLTALIGTPVVAQNRTCTFTNYGASCGPVFTGGVSRTGNTNHVSMTVTNAASTSRILIMVGAVKLNIALRPVFGGNLACFLLVRPDFMQNHRPDPNGKYVWAHSLPSTHAGIAFAQVAEIKANGTILTSKGLQLICK